MSDNELRSIRMTGEKKLNFSVELKRLSSGLIVC